MPQRLMEKDARGVLCGRDFLGVKIHVALVDKAFRLTHCAAFLLHAVSFAHFLRHGCIAHAVENIDLWRVSPA